MEIIKIIKFLPICPKMLPNFLYSVLLIEQNLPQNAAQFFFYSFRL